MLKKIGIYILIFCMLFCYTGTVEAAETNQFMISCSAQVDGSTVTISGYIKNKTGVHNITLRIGEVDNIIHLGQTQTDDFGNFVFRIPFSQEVPAGTYPYVVNSNVDVTVFTGTFQYDGFPTETTSLFNSEFIVNIGSNYIPSISGTASCAKGKNLRISVLSKDKSDIIVNDTVVFEDGKYELKFSNTEEILNQKQSHVNIICGDGNQQLAEINATLIYSWLLVGFSGRIELANGVWAYVQVQSLDSNFFNKKAVVRSSQDVSFTLPNLMINSAYRIKIWGYYNEPIIEEEDMKTSYSVYGSSNKTITVIAKGENIPNIKNQVFTLSYDQNILTPVKYFGLTPKEELQPGVYNNVEIQSIQDGDIRFKMIDIPSYSNRKWSGVIDIFKFKFKPNTIPTVTSISITHEEVQ